MSRPKESKQAGGWTTRREPDGILLHVGSYAVGVKEEDKEKPIWIEKSKAVSLAHTIMEAMIRFWDIDLHPEYARRNATTLAENVGLRVTEPYREACPFCQFVADDRVEMYKHLEEEHSIVLVTTKEEPGQ